MVSEQGNLSAEAVRANQSDARAWSPAPSRRTIVVLTRINANPEIIKMNLKVMEMNTAPNGAENPNRALWEKGDFTEIAAFMRQSGGGSRGVSWNHAAATGLGPGLRRRHDGSSARPFGSRRDRNRYCPEPRGSREQPRCGSGSQP